MTENCLLLYIWLLWWRRVLRFISRECAIWQLINIPHTEQQCRPNGKFHLTLLLLLLIVCFVYFSCLLVLCRGWCCIPGVVVIYQLNSTRQQIEETQTKWIKQKYITNCCTASARRRNVRVARQCSFAVCDVCGWMEAPHRTLCVCLEGIRPFSSRLSLSLSPFSKVWDDEAAIQFDCFEN